MQEDQGSDDVVGLFEESFVVVLAALFQGIGVGLVVVGVILALGFFV